MITKIKNLIKNHAEIVLKFISALGVIYSIFFGFNQINLSIKNQRFSNRLELADDLLSEYIELSGYASKAVFYMVADANGEAEKLIEIDSNYPNYVQMHVEALESIKEKIMAYGSSELVYLFCESYSDVQIERENEQVDFNSLVNYFYSMPLIASYIKYDMTGEMVNPSVFYNLFMMEMKELEQVNGMENFHQEMISRNNELVEKYDLPKEFIWKERE